MFKLPLSNPLHQCGFSTTNKQGDVPECCCLTFFFFFFNSLLEREATQHLHHLTRFAFPIDFPQQVKAHTHGDSFRCMDRKWRRILAVSEKLHLKAELSITAPLL